MTIRASRFRAWWKTLLWIVPVSVLFYIVVPRLRGEIVNIQSMLEFSVIGGAFIGIFVAVSFSPSEINWDEHRVSIFGSWPKSGAFEWSDLEAWSPYGNGVFLIKFRGQQAYQISPAGFLSADWKVFKSMMKERFARKKTWLWLGPMPVRFRRD